MLTQRLGEAQQLAKQRHLKVELAVYTTAADAGRDASALLDSREFMARTAAARPGCGGFLRPGGRPGAGGGEAAEVPVPAAAAARACASEPAGPQRRPRQPPAAPPAQASGADFCGAPGQGRLWTQADYDNYMATANTHDRDGKKLTEAIQRGELAALGIGPGKRRNRR